MTRKQRVVPAGPAILDACCLIDLLVSGHCEAILRATGYSWHLPSAVQAELQYIRRHDPDQPGSYRNAPVDLSPFVNSGLLTFCEPENSREQDRFIDYAVIFRSDGEAMCLALAEARGWTVATDDLKAIRIAGQTGLTVVSSPALLKRWADRARPDAARLRRALNDIQTLARFVPRSTMPEADWWSKSV